MTDKNPLPNSKFSRFSKASKTALNVAGKHAVYKASTLFTSKEKNKIKQEAHYQKIAKEIFKTLSVLKGTALKAAQVMSLELELLPEAFKVELKKACYQVPPLNRSLVRKVIQNQFNDTPESLFHSFDSTAFAAASIGQVHRAVTKDNRSVAVKIQYPGIDQTIHHDMGLLKLLLLKLPIPELKRKAPLLTTFLIELEKLFLDETDYEKEKNNMDFFYNNTPFSFFVYFFKTKHTLHADPNPGNYLFMKEGKLGVLDFGCIKKCDPEFPDQLITIIQSYIQKNMKNVMEIYNEWGLLPLHLKGNSQKVDDHLTFFREWITLPHKTDRFDFGKHPDYMAQRFTPDFRDALNILHNTTHNFVMFDRAYMGLLNIFQRLNAQVRISFS